MRVIGQASGLHAPARAARVRPEGPNRPSAFGRSGLFGPSGRIICGLRRDKGAGPSGRRPLVAPQAPSGLGLRPFGPRTLAELVPACRRSLKGGTTFGRPDRMYVQKQHAKRVVQPKQGTTLVLSRSEGL